MKPLVALVALVVLAGPLLAAEGPLVTRAFDLGALLFAGREPVLGRLGLASTSRVDTWHDVEEETFAEFLAPDAIVELSSRPGGPPSPGPGRRRCPAGPRGPPRRGTP